MSTYHILYIDKFNAWVVGKLSEAPIAQVYEEKDAIRIAEALNAMDAATDLKELGQNFRERTDEKEHT